MGDTPKPVNWTEAVHALGECFGSAPFEPSVLAYLEAAACKRILVACSGGADSVCLLCLLVERAPALGLTLHLAHYNHGWRGVDADADAAFVRSLAAAFELPYSEGRRPPNEDAFTETTARTLRLDFLRRVAKHQSCDAIAFGHQLDDVLETQLQRLARGVGCDGLAAPRPVAWFDGYPTHLRPLLHLRTGAIRMSLNAASIPWREDLSNEDVGIARNGLRKQIIPDLNELLARDVAQGAARSRRLLEEDALALEELARERLPEAYSGSEALSRDAVRSLAPALIRRALAAWLSGHGLISSVSASAMDLIVETALGPRERFRMSLGNDFLVMSAQALTVERGDLQETGNVLRATRFQPGESVLLSTGAYIESEPLELDEVTRHRIGAGAVDPACEAYLRDTGATSWEVRPWRSGDRFRPLGAPGTKKLKDWFIDRGVPPAERKIIPLVTQSDGVIVWVPGFPPAESCKIMPSTKRALRLTYHSSHPL